MSACGVPDCVLGKPHAGSHKTAIKPRPALVPPGGAMHDLPPAAVDLALGLVDAVRLRDPDAVAALIGGMTATGDTAAVLVALASMVDDSKHVSELLAWAEEDDRRIEWRRSLTDDECESWAHDHDEGDRSEEAEDGWREHQERERARLVARREAQALKRAQNAARAAIEAAEQRAREAA